MRLMGLDYGDKIIGIALSDEMGWTAQGLQGMIRKNRKADLDELVRLAREYAITEIVIGLPKNMNGSVGPRGEKSMSLAKDLEYKLQIPVQLWDERLTTVAAERTLIAADVSRQKRKEVVDKMAAVLILQGYMDRNSNSQR